MDIYYYFPCIHGHPLIFSLHPNLEELTCSRKDPCRGWTRGLSAHRTENTEKCLESFPKLFELL